MKGKIEIFCCYARKNEDQQLLSKLRIHLIPFEKKGLISVWHDTAINPGTEWEGEINNHLETADVILILVSPDFIASEYCYGREMKRAMERHDRAEACIVPIILRPVFWQSAPFGKLQVLPIEARPVTDPAWGSQDEAFLNVVEGIYHIVTLLLTRQYLAEGEATYDLGDYKAALFSYEQIIANLDPNCVAAYLGKGKALEALDRSKEALAAYNQATDLNANFDPQVSYKSITKRSAYTAKNQKPLHQHPAHEKTLHNDVNSLKKSNTMTGMKMFGYQQAAYQFLIQIIEWYGAKNAVFIQYSCTTSLPVVYALLRKGAKVTVYIQHEDTAAKMGSQFQASRIVDMTRDLRSNLGDILLKPDKLKVYKYHTPCSMSAIKIDNRVICMGWYTYEQKKEDLDQKNFPNDIMDLSGHDRAAVVVWKETSKFHVSGENISMLEGVDGFSMFDKTFSLLENNYREYAENVFI